MPLTKEFLKHERRVEENYLGKPVATRFKKEFGLKYNKKDIRPKAIKLAKTRGIQIEKIQETDKGVILNE